MKKFKNVYSIGGQEVKTSLNQSMIDGLIKQYTAGGRELLTREFIKWAIAKTPYYSFEYEGIIYKQGHSEFKHLLNRG